MQKQTYTSTWDADSCQLTLLVTSPLTATLAGKITITKGTTATKDYTFAAGDYEKLIATGLVFKNDFLSDIFLKDNSVGPDVFFEISDDNNSFFILDNSNSKPVSSFLNIVSVEYDRSKTNSNMVKVSVIGSLLDQTDYTHLTISENNASNISVPSKTYTFTHEDLLVFNELEVGKMFTVSIPASAGSTVNANFVSGTMQSTIKPVLLLSVPSAPVIDVIYTLNNTTYDAKITIHSILTNTLESGYDDIANLKLMYKMFEDVNWITAPSLAPFTISSLLANTNKRLQFQIKNKIDISQMSDVSLCPNVLPKPIKYGSVKIDNADISDIVPPAPNPIVNVYGTSFTVSGWASDDSNQKSYNVSAWLEDVGDAYNTPLNKSTVNLATSKTNLLTDITTYTLSDYTFSGVRPGTYDLHMQASNANGVGSDAILTKSTKTVHIVVKSIPSEVINPNKTISYLNGIASEVVFTLSSLPLTTNGIVPGKINILIGSDSTFAANYTSHTWDLSTITSSSGPYTKKLTNSEHCVFTYSNIQNKLVFVKMVVEEKNNSANVSNGVIVNMSEFINYQTPLAPPTVPLPPIQLFTKANGKYNVLFEWTRINEEPIVKANGDILDSIEYVITDSSNFITSSQEHYRGASNKATVALSARFAKYELYLYAKYKNSSLCVSAPTSIPSFSVLDVSSLIDPPAQSAPLLTIDNDDGKKLKAVVTLVEFTHTAIVELTETLTGVVQVFPINVPTTALDRVTPTVTNLLLTAANNPGTYKARVIVNLNGTIPYSIESAFSSEVKLVPVLTFSDVVLSSDKKSIDFKINRIRSDPGQVKAFMILEDGSLDQDNSISFIADTGLSVNKTITTSAEQKIKSYILIASAGTQQAVAYFDGSYVRTLPQQFE
jgi:hypothetical protein